jgi:Phytanoyl-CoA dioxygenase (PhyH)
MRFPEIDYQSHPAYAPFRSGVRYDDVFIEDRIREIDSISADFCADAEAGEQAAADALARIRNELDRVLSHATERGISAVAEEWLRVCARWTVADFAYEFARRVSSRREYRPVSLSTREVEQLSAVRSLGMYIADLPPRLYGEIRRSAMLQFEELKTRATVNPRMRAVNNVAFNSALWKAIKRAVEEAGVPRVLGEFKRNEMTMLGAGLEYSHPGQRWYQDLYADVALAPGPFQYLHYDEGDCLPKSMIYVTPVGEDSGPTRAIPGSNCWENSECKIRMHRALDRIIGDRYRELSQDGDYRLLARRPELRRVFMDLPRAFRGSSHFGDDILPDTELAATLQALEVPYVSDGGQTMVFDGPHLLHRGSLVKSGERLSLQVVYRNRNEAKIRSKLARQTLMSEQLSLWRKYARRFVMEHA